MTIRLQSDNEGALGIPSIGNVTATALDNGETFTGEWELNGYNDVLFQVKTDVACSVYADFSSDGSNVDSTLTFATTAGVPDVHRLAKGYRYFRLRVDNDSGSNQTYLRLAVAFGTFGPLTAPRNLAVAPDGDTLVTRQTDFKLDQAQGRFTGEVIRRKFGSASGVTNSANVILSTLKPTAATFVGFMTSATTVRIKSGGDANDTAAGTGAQSVVIEGLDANFEAISETVATAGASASSSTSASFIRVLRAYVDAVGTYHGANAAAITIEKTAGSADLIQIAAGAGQTESAFDTIPANTTAYITNMNVDVDGTKEATILLYQVQSADDVTTPFSPKRLIKRLVGVTGTREHNFTQYVAVPEKSDIWLEVLGPSGGAEVSGAFEMIRVAT